jgi:site-specific DNA recombinase
MARAITEGDVPLPHVAAIYRRVSSVKQSAEDKFSLDTQLAEARAWCAAHGWETSEHLIYTDVWTGEDLWQRTALMRLLEDVDARSVGLVLAHAVDRLSRDTTGAHLAIIAERIERAGVRLECVTEPLDATPMGVLMRQLRAFAAGIENTKRVERTQRIRRNRAASGKLLASDKPLFGYRWDDTNVDHMGRLLKERYVEDPDTAWVVRRIFAEACAGKSMRAIAYDLTHECIPTPRRKPGARWEQATIAYVLRTSTYWGEPRALRTVTVPVPAHLRAAGPVAGTGTAATPGYKYKSREIPRPDDQQIPLPADVAPALVTREQAQTARARLQWNREHATALYTAARQRGQHDYEPLLRGGFAVCAGCGGMISVNHLQSTSVPGKIRHRYVCRRLRVKGACTPRTVECERLDTAVWETVTELLQDRAWIAQEVERLRAAPDPTAAALGGIDRQLADLDRRIERKRAYAELVDDARERAAVAAEVGALWEQRDALSQQRAAAVAHYAAWREQREGLEETLAWCDTVSEAVSARVAEVDTAMKRRILAALRVRVSVGRTDEVPRLRMRVTLPLTGVRDVPLALGSAQVQSDKGITAPYKYPREIEFVTELPKTISGKIRRVELREREQQRRSASE